MLGLLCSLCFDYDCLIDPHFSVFFLGLVLVLGGKTMLHCIAFIEDKTQLDKFVKVCFCIPFCILPAYLIPISTTEHRLWRQSACASY